MPSDPSDGFATELASRLGTYIKRAEQALMSEKTAALRRFELTVPQYTAMLALHYGPAQSAAQLARHSNVTPQTMAMILTNLESKRLIERHPSPLHGKVQVTTLTPAGEAIVLRADEVAKGVEERMRLALTEEESDEFRSLLTRVAAALRTPVDVAAS